MTVPRAVSLRLMVAVLVLSACTRAMRVSGIVSDARTHAPVAGARIAIEDRVTYTSPEGVYRLKVHRADVARVSATALGHAPREVVCPALTRQPVCDIALEPERVP